MKRSLGILLIVAALVPACSSVPMVTDMDLFTYENNGELPRFYRQLQEELKVAKPGSDLAENRQLYIEKTAQRIAEKKEQAILDELDREFEKHSITTLQASLDKAADIREYSTAVYEGLRQQLEQAMSQKKGVILGKEAEYYELPDTEAEKKVRLLDEIAAIYGPGIDADQAMAQRTAFLAGLLQSAREAMKNKRYEDARLFIDNLEKVDPSYAGIDEVRHQLLAADYEQQFWDALEKGETDRAYATFYRLTQIPDYISTHPDVVPIAEDMAQFFIAEGDQSMKVKAVDAAYQSYSRVRYIRSVTNTADIYSPGERKFVDLVDKQLLANVNQSRQVPAYGLVLVIQEMMPGHPSVMKYLESLQTAVREEASAKIITSNLMDNTAEHSLGAALVARVSERLTAGLPGELQLIDSKMAAESFMPAQIVGMPNPSSFLILSGEVRDVKVSRKERTTSETKRVLTSHVKELNPEYEAWLKLGKRKQRELPQPSPTIERPVEEDVVLSKTLIEQTGVFSVAYRLADAVSASVVFSDSINHAQTFTYEDIPGVDAGLFVVEGKKAEVRSEEKVIDELTQGLADEMGKKIIEQVKMLQSAYINKAGSAVVVEDFNLAATNYAYAYALSQVRGNPDEDALARLRTYALRWR